MLTSPLLKVCSFGWLLNIGCLEPGLYWTWLSWTFVVFLNLSMIFRSTELFFFYFEASFLLSYLSSKILEMFFFYFEESFLLSYLSSRILIYLCFELFSFYFEASFLPWVTCPLVVIWFGFPRVLGFCLLKSSKIAFSLINFSKVNCCLFEVIYC